MTVPVFVQLDSEQACLLGMNALPFLGIEVRHSNGIQILPSGQKPENPLKPAVSKVSLLISTVVPSHKGCVLPVGATSPDVTL